MTLVMADLISRILLLCPECEYVFFFSYFAITFWRRGFNRYFPSYRLISCIVSTVGHIFFRVVLSISCLNSATGIRPFFLPLSSYYGCSDICLTTINGYIFRHLCSCILTSLILTFHKHFCSSVMQ